MSKFIWRNIPDTWQVVKIGELLKLEYGKSLLSSKRDESGSVTVYGSGGVIGKHSQAIGDYPTIIIGRKGSVGSINLSQNKFWCIDTAFYTTNIVSEVSIDYLYFLLTKIDLSRLSIVVGVPGINRDAILNSKIPLPPLAEQKQIVAILQEADALRRKKKEILEKSNRLASALFLEMFGDPVRNEKGWDVKKLEEFGKIITGNTPPRENPKNYNDNYIEWIKTDNINNDNIFIAKAKEYLSKEGVLIGRVLEPGAVLVTCIAGSLNSIGSAAITDRKVAFNQQINAIQPFENVNSLYLLFLIKSSKASIQSFARNALKNIISKSVFSNIKLILPPLPLQNDFAKKVEAIEDTTKQIESSLQKMEKLYESLLQKAFTGDLTESWRKRNPDAGLSKPVSQNRPIGLFADQSFADVDYLTEPTTRPSESSPRLWLKKQLSEEQKLVLDKWRKWGEFPITPQTRGFSDLIEEVVYEGQGMKVEEKKEIVIRILNQLVGIGFAEKISVQTSEYGYITGYRYLGENDRSKTKISDLNQLQSKKAE